MQSHRALLCDLDGTLYKPPLIKLNQPGAVMVSDQPADRR